MPAIELDHVSRHYQKYSAKHRFQTFKSAIVKGDLFKSLRADEVVAAVDDVSFVVEKGETFGLIGENGSGKSTILKMVAGIAKPSAGRLSVQGKVSALIELGAGFHPEISGRENVFINGIMLGLTKKEITQKFDGDRPFRRTRGLHRGPGQDVFLGDVHAARVHYRHQRQSRGAARRRSPGRRRRGLRSQVPRPDRRFPPPEKNHPVRQPRPVHGLQNLQPRRLDQRTEKSRCWASPSGSSTPTCRT